MNSKNLWTFFKIIVNIFTMPSVDSVIKPILSHYVDLPLKEQHKDQNLVAKVAVTVSYCLASIRAAISAFLLYLQGTRHLVFENPILNRSVNEGKLSDQKIYDTLKACPLPLKDVGKNFLTSVGCQLNETTISPVRSDDGKCKGSVVYFLSEHQTGRPVHDIASDLIDGVPIAATIYQEIYTKIFTSWQPTKLMKAILRVDLDARHHPTSTFFTKTWELQGFSADEIGILEGVHEYARTYDPLTHTYACHLTDFVNNWVECFDITMTDSQWWALKCIYHYLICPKEAEKLIIDDITLSLGGLEIENFVEGPEKILEALPQLDAGDYQLCYPYYNSHGGFDGRHTVALTVEKDGFSYLYDPNQGTGWMGPWENQRTETVRRLLKHSTGYSTTAANFITRIMKLLLDQPLYPTDPQKQKCILLYKVRKIERK